MLNAFGIPCQIDLMSTECPMVFDAQIIGHPSFVDLRIRHLVSLPILESVVPCFARGVSLCQLGKTMNSSSAKERSSPAAQRDSMFGRRISLFTISGFKVYMDLSWLVLAVLVTWSLAQGAFPVQFQGLSSTTYWWMGALA